MTDDLNRVLSAIEELNCKFSERFDQLEKTVISTRKSQKKHDGEIKSLKKHQKQQKVDIDEIKKILQLMSESDALIRRKDDKVYLDKDKVYGGFECAGIPKYSAMAELGRNNLIETMQPKNTRTVVIWDSVQNKAVRAISVYLPIE